MRKILFVVFVFFSTSVFAQFCGPAGTVGSSAIHKDSSVFKSWASNCIVTRGYQDIADTSFGYASVGSDSLGIGMAGANGTVTLGDGGYAILTFDKAIANGVGYDFAVFENSFNNTFLELAFVEVSSDGINFFRFPATSNTQDTLQMNSFGAIDATLLNNLAGKYKALYGTPFDLDELQGTLNLDLNNVKYVKVVDVVGTISEMFATKDINNHKVNDPYPTAFASGGFDLDAVGVINERPAGISEADDMISYVYPIPTSDGINIFLAKENFSTIKISNGLGQLVYLSQVKTNQINVSTSEFPNGLYFLKIMQGDKVQVKKIVVEH